MLLNGYSARAQRHVRYARLLATADSRRKGAAGEHEFAQAILDTYQVKLHRRLEQVRSGGNGLSVDPDSVGPVAQWPSAHAIEVQRYRAVTPALISN